MKSISTPYELPLPGKAHFSTKERFFEMRSFAAEIWREENGFEDGALARIQKRKPRKVRAKNIENRIKYR